LPKKKILVNLLFAKSVGEFHDKDVMLDDEDFDNFGKIVSNYNYWSIHHSGTLKSNHGEEGCPGLKEMINMTPYGDVLTCANNHIYLGNVRDEPLAVIRERIFVKSFSSKKLPKLFLASKSAQQVETIPF